MTRSYTRYTIEIEDMRAIDLRKEAEGAVADGQPWETGRILIEGKAEPAEYLAVDDRIGIAWGADADWDDLILARGTIQESIDTAIARWLEGVDE